MCANYLAMLAAHAELFGMPIPTFAYQAQIYPNYAAPLIFKNTTNNNAWEWREAVFGLIPKWSKDKKIAKHTYNARSETVQEKPSFKTAWLKSQFCLIPAEKIYEPRYIDGKAQRWAIQPKDDSPFTMAGIYEIAKIEGQIIRSFSLLTINAVGHPLMQQFHQPEDEKRSVVIIPADLRDDWLSVKHQHAKELLLHINAEDYKSYHDAKPVPTAALNTSANQFSLF
jgi:putative SOS response-associated peptidase YedK